MPRRSAARSAPTGWPASRTSARGPRDGRHDQRHPARGRRIGADRRSDRSSVILRGGARSVVVMAALLATAGWRRPTTRSVTLDGRPWRLLEGSADGMRGAGFGDADGMLFDRGAEVDPRPVFVMDGVAFPLDIAWFDGAGRLVGTATMPVCQAEPCPRTRGRPVRWAVEARRRLRGPARRRPAGGRRELAVDRHVVRRKPRMRSKASRLFSRRSQPWPSSSYQWTSWILSSISSASTIRSVMSGTTRLSLRPWRMSSGAWMGSAR